MTLSGVDLENVGTFSKSEFINITSIDSRVNVGESLTFRESNDWYQFSLYLFGKRNI